MAADPAMIDLAANALCLGFSTPERVAIFLADEDQARLAAQLAEKRGAAPLILATDAPEQEVASAVNAAAMALQLRLTDPDLLKASLFANRADADELARIAVGLARKAILGAGHDPARQENWASVPATKSPAVVERDPSSFKTLGPMVRGEPETQADLMACIQGVHHFGEPDHWGWRECKSCGLRNVAVP